MSIFGGPLSSITSMFQNKMNQQSAAPQGDWGEGPPPPAVSKTGGLLGGVNNFLQKVDDFKATPLGKLVGSFRMNVSNGSQAAGFNPQRGNPDADALAGALAKRLMVGGNKGQSGGDNPNNYGVSHNEPVDSPIYRAAPEHFTTGKDLLEEGKEKLLNPFGLNSAFA